MSPRALAARVIVRVIEQGRALDDALAELLPGQGEARDRALVSAIAYGVLRWHPRLHAIAAELMPRPLKARDRDIAALVLVGLVQLLYMRVPAHAAIAETVEAARVLHKPWAAGLVNGVLRRFQRDREALLEAVDQQEVARFAHPRWLLDRLKQDWPADWPQICDANNTHPPMVLRVNRRRGSVPDYLQQLAAAGLTAAPAHHAPAALVLVDPVAAEALPGFADGAASVQDAAAQLAVPLLDLAADQRVLDACAAPGGKTGHLLEWQDGLASAWALDLDPARLARVAENLARLGLSAHLVPGDAQRPAAWWDGTPFDRILLDAPCSATGVIRRHPDIKTLRRPADIERLVQHQASLLAALWPLLAPGGRLLYVTCSVLRSENEERIAGFLAAHADAFEIALAVPWGRPCRHGRQILPGDDGMDGFYYAALSKRHRDAADGERPEQS
jgi:16S rRNA (cytosine967-C5)-methyltransferase